MAPLRVASLVLLLACIGVSSAKELSQEVLDKIDDALDLFARSAHSGNAAALATPGRRLEAHLSESEPIQTMPTVNYGIVCTGSCWNLIKEKFTTAMTTMDSSECKEQKRQEKTQMAKTMKQNVASKSYEIKEKLNLMGVGPAPPKNGSQQGGGGPPKNGSQQGGGGGGQGGQQGGGGKKPKVKSAACIYDLCSETEISDMCTNGFGNYTGIDSCQKANVEFLCNSVCHTTCQDSIDVKKLLCGSSGKGGGGKHGGFSNNAGGGGMRSMLNYMCSKKDDSDTYCYDLIRTEISSLKLSRGEDLTGFPDPCDVAASCNGTSDMKTSIENMGCCFGAFLDAQRKYRIAKPGQMRTAKALAKVCDISSALQACTKKSSDLSVKRSNIFTLDSQKTCAAFADEKIEASTMANMAVLLNLTEGSVEMFTCKKKGSTCSRRLHDSRRMSATGSEVAVDITTMGGDANQQMAALETAMASLSFRAELMSTASGAAVLSMPEITTTAAVGIQASFAKASHTLSLSLVSMLCAFLYNL